MVNLENMTKIYIHIFICFCMGGRFLDWSLSQCMDWLCPRSYMYPRPECKHVGFSPAVTDDTAFEWKQTSWNIKIKQISDGTNRSPGEKTQLRSVSRHREELQLMVEGGRKGRWGAGGQQWHLRWKAAGRHHAETRKSSCKTTDKHISFPLFVLLCVSPSHNLAGERSYLLETS